MLPLYEKEKSLIENVIPFRLSWPQIHEESDKKETSDPALPNTGIFENQILSAVKSLTLNPAEIPKNTGISREVFPSPSHGNFGLTMSSMPEKLQVFVMDILVLVIQTFKPDIKMNDSALGINDTDLPDGVNFLKITGDGLFEMKKIVVD
jgi:hypothetical protein